MIGGAAMPLGFALRVAMLLGALLATAAHAELANRIVATIDGEPVTAHELRQYVKERGDALPDTDALDALITQKLLEKEIKAAGIAARDEDVDRYMQEVQSRSGLDEEAFVKALEERGMTRDSYRAKVKSEIERAQLVNREIRQRVNVSSAEVRRYYDAHLDNYATSERVKVRGIFIPVEHAAEADAIAAARSRAEDVRDRARKGTSFEALAKEYSAGPGADKGGELGTFARGEMESTLDDVVFALQPGQVSDPIATPGGFHVLFVEERIAGAHRPLDEVSDEIRESLYSEALEQRFQNWLSRDLRERHHVEVLH
jgi:peptidyl-prolyl cis-trans isomerase SurA